MFGSPRQEKKEKYHYPMETDYLYYFRNCDTARAARVRFTKIASRLPLEIQTVLWLRAVGLGGSMIPTKELDRAVFHVFAEFEGEARALEMERTGGRKETE